MPVDTCSSPLRRGPLRRSAAARREQVQVSRAGHIVTNGHAVNLGGRIAVRGSDGTERETALLYSDEAADLAVLRPISRPAEGALIPIRSPTAPIRWNEAVHAFSFPESVATGGLFPHLRGDVTAMEGPGRNALRFGISAHISPGFSGGPVLDDDGRVVGIAVIGIPGSGLNFAVRTGPLVDLLRRAGGPSVVVRDGIGRTPSADRVRPFVVQVLCHG
ncbi:S1 family peptidase [Falsiroseomonas sp. HC035]|uniref:S1 family peptidase n=1 Tax=Falsiroseomonas sp. HC035 TaxID=3390999 RepID=UPI003D31145C